MYQNREKKFPYLSLSVSRRVFHSPIHKLDSCSNFRNKLSQLFMNKTRSKPKKRVLTPRKIPKNEKNILSIQEVLTILSFKKEKENERKRQFILSKIKHVYSTKVPNNYYIMFINNLLSDKSNRIKSRFTELLNLIETKELISNYFLRKESRIKLAYLTKLFSYNIRVFPNYIKNEKIYDIMANYLIQKEKLIIRIERNKRINILKRKLLGLMKGDQHELEIIKKDIDSFTKDNIDLEDDLHNLNDNSFSYSFGNKSDTINKIQNLIKDMSTFLKNTNNDCQNKNEEIINDKKNIIIDNDKDLKPLNISNNKRKSENNLKEKQNDIKKTKTEIKKAKLNDNKIIQKLMLSNLFQTKEKLLLPLQNINSKKELSRNKPKMNIFKSKTFRINELKTRHKLDLNINNKKQFNTINNNLIPIKTNGVVNEKNSKKNDFKPTNQFLFFLSKNENNPPKGKIKKSIMNVIKKYGLSRNKSLKTDSNKKLKNSNDKVYNTLDLNNNLSTQNKRIVKKGLSLNINIKNKKNFFEKLNGEGNIFSARTIPIKNKLRYSDLFNIKKPINMKTLVESERVEFNIEKYMKIKNNLLKHEKKKKNK